MNKLKAFWHKPFGKITILGIGGLILFVLAVKLFTPSEKISDVATQMQHATNDIVSGDVKLTTQETLNSVAGQQARTQSQVSDIEQKQQQFIDALNKKINTLKASQKDTFKEQQQKITEQLKALTAKKNKINDTGKKTEPTKQGDFIIGNGQANDVSVDNHSTMVWVTDSSSQAPNQKTGSMKNTASVLHPDDSSEKPKPIPYFTIPQNSTLVDVRSEQPLIGVIPVNGTVTDPETIQFIIGKKGLLANNWGLPSALKGMHGSATCAGVYEITRGSVKCSITSMTFIFVDGRVATVNGTDEKPLGHLTDHYGNDYIPGDLHTNFGWNAGGTALFSGIQGAGGAFASSQEQTTSNATGSIASTEIKNVGDYALGSAGQNGGQALNTWWQNVMKSTTNYVYVPNWDKKTHKLLLLNAVITTSVPINYNPTGRKVIYNHENTTEYNTLD